MLLEKILSRHSTPIDRKIQKDWAEVMQQFGLPADNHVSKVAVDEIVVHKSHGNKSNKAFKFVLAFAGTLAVTVAGLSSTDKIDISSLSSIDLNEFFVSTTLSSIVKTVKPASQKQASEAKTSICYFNQRTGSICVTDFFSKR